MDQQQAQQFGNMMAGFVGVFMIIFFLVAAFMVFLFWRIFTKAGMAGALSLLVIVPFGPIIVLCILAFGEWKVVPVQIAAPYYPPPSYPPPPPPPPSFQPPPTQL